MDAEEFELNRSVRPRHTETQRVCQKVYKHGTATLELVCGLSYPTLILNLLMSRNGSNAPLFRSRFTLLRPLPTKVTTDSGMCKHRKLL